MIVYGAVLSPFVRKVLAVAGEKGVAIESRRGGFGQGGEEFAQASPFGKIPAFRDPGARADGGDLLLADSSAIAHYLEAKYPDPPLIPADAALRGETVWLDEFADTILMGIGGRMFFNRFVMPVFLGQAGNLADADRAESDDLPRALDWLDRRIGDRPWLVGDAITLADFSVAAPFANIAHAGYILDVTRYPNIHRWLGSVNARPHVAQPLAKMAAIIAKMGGA